MLDNAKVRYGQGTTLYSGLAFIWLSQANGPEGGTNRRLEGVTRAAEARLVKRARRSALLIQSSLNVARYIRSAGNCVGRPAYS